MRPLNRILKTKMAIFWLIFFVILLYYIEIHTYSRNRHTWAKLQCETKQFCTKIMLIADPQLIGYRNERFGITPFTVFDSDRYLSNTFNYAYDFIQPDVMIFLGDLFDEGSIASDEEFKLYGRRLFNIFLNEKSSAIKHIFIPGDNDIGGEGRDKITTHKLKRFEAMFHQPDTIKMKNITFYKINRFLQTIPKLPQTIEFYETTKIVVGLSHIPLMFIPSPFVEKLLSRMQPHLLFTAHEHGSMMISTDALVRDTRKIIPITPQTTDKVHKVTLGVSDMYEIIVPTCSYRMGTDKIGYGFAIIENEEFQYTVLWSPSRFPQLLMYFMGINSLLFYLSYKLFKKCLLLKKSKQRNDNHNHSNSKTKLII